MIYRKSAIEISNPGSEPLLVMLEPWGEDYWLLPEESFTFRAIEPRDGFYFELIQEADQTAVYAEGHCRDVEVRLGETIVACGHNRPPGAFTEA